MTGCNRRLLLEVRERHVTRLAACSSVAPFVTLEAPVDAPRGQNPPANNQQGEKGDASSHNYEDEVLGEVRLLHVRCARNRWDCWGWIAVVP